MTPKRRWNLFSILLHLAIVWNDGKQYWFLSSISDGSECVYFTFVLRFDRVSLSLDRSDLILTDLVQCGLHDSSIASVWNKKRHFKYINHFPSYSLLIRISCEMNYYLCCSFSWGLIVIPHSFVSLFVCFIFHSRYQFSIPDIAIHVRPASMRMICIQRN